MTMPSISLAGRLVALRDFTADDADAAYEIVGDERVTRWLSFDARDAAATATMIGSAMREARANPRTEYYLAIEALARPGLVGFIRLALGSHRAAKLGYAIHAEHWGHGYATDAAEAMLTFGFSDLALHRVTAAVGPDNSASIGVLQRLGFKPEGRLRDHVFTNGAWRDSLLYSLLAHEFVASTRQ